MALVSRIIELDFTTPGGSLSILGPRCSVDLEDAGTPVPRMAHIRVHGLSRDHLNTLSRYQMGSPYLLKSTVTIRAGDETSGLKLAFNGLILSSFADMSGAPDVSLQVLASGTSLQALSKANPSTFPGWVDAAQVLQTLAGAAGLKFQNNGLSVILAHPYLWGSPQEQIVQCAQAAKAHWIISLGTLIVWPSTSNNGQGAVTISADTGMVGYPAFNGQSMVVTTLYDSTIRFGQQINVKSSMQTASGSFVAQGVNHRLESQTPNGAWFTQVLGYKFSND